MLPSRKTILLVLIASIGLTSVGSMDSRGGALEDFDTFIKEEQEEFISYSQEQWNKMRDEKEQGIFIFEEELLAPPKVEKVEEIRLEEEEAVPPAPEGIGIILPFESRLSITGRKMISMKYGAVFYKDEDERTTTGTPAGVTEGFDMDQELQVKIKGNVGRKITVNVDYDDTVEDKRDISVVYKGDPDEIVREAAFGDITLELPATEFVAYKKSVFGGKLNAQYKELKFMAIGSQTKGIPEEKKFKGKSTFEKRDINDTSYRRRKYYELWDTNIQSGSEQVYIDDRDGTNNQNGTEMMVRNSLLTPATYWGYFNLQVPGQDYTIDYIKGIITFRKTIYENYVIAVDYQKSDTTWLREENVPDEEPKILKDENELLNQEMMNYYDFGRKKIIQGIEGRDFVVKILDLNRNEVTTFGNVYDLIEMDYDEGILKFKNRKPLGAAYGGYDDIYNKTNPQHHYIVYVEYKYRQKTYFLRPNIVEGSEKITLNDRSLKRDEDYFIDYESGFITFFREEEIDEETEIKINYEYMPFAGLYQETLLGARGEWAPSDRFFLGSTLLYSGAAKSAAIPNVRTTPGSKFIVDANSEFSFDPQPFFPFQTKISGELARSLNNPNTWGKAIIDSMEGVKLIDGMPVDKDVWQIASNPGGVITQEGAISWDNQDVKIKEIKPNADVGEDEEQEVLKISYDLTGNATASIVYPISTRGVDYSQKESLELYVYGDNKGEILEITLGSIAEDADGDADLDTEDINGDGTLNVGEDVGWQFSNWTGDDEKIYLRDGKIGYKNGKIDTEDLDGDHVGPEAEGYVFPFSTGINWSGWKKVEWDLGITTDTASNWTAIKHIRITLKGTDVSGSIKVASMGVVGNKWERGIVQSTDADDNFSVVAVNTEDDYDVYGRGLLDNKDYEDLYGERDVEEKEVEQTLSLKYTLISGATGYTKWTFTRAEDYSQYKELKFFIKNPDYPTKNPTFIMRLGTPGDYYQFERTVNWGNWKLLTIDLLDKDGKYGADTMESSDGTITRVGSPDLTNIAEIKLMVVNDTGSDISDGEIWVNEIHVTGARKKEGWAGRIGLDCELPGWFTFGGKYWYMDRNYETITVPSKNQDKEVISAYTNFNRLDYLPLSLNWSKTTTVTPSAVRVEDLSFQDEGRVVSHQGSASAELRLPKLPRLGTSYTKSIVDRSRPEGKREDADTYSAILHQYELPVRFFLLPQDFGGSYKRINKYNKFTSTAPTEKNFREFTNDWSGKATFRPLSDLSIVPSYSRRNVRERVYVDGEINRPRSGTQTAGFNSTLQFFEWLKPSLNYSITNTENFIIVTGTSTPTEKNFTRTSSAKLNLPFVAKSLFPKFKPVDSLNITSSYALDDGDSYEKIGEDYPVYGKLWLRGNGMGYRRLEGIEDKLKSFSLRDTFRIESNWKPLEFLNLEGYLYPFKTITTDIDYTRTQSRQGPTILDSEKRIWPYLDIRMSSLEKFPLLGLAMEEVEMITKYILTKEDARNVSLGKKVDFSEDLRFKLFEDYYFWLTYSSSRNRVKSAPSWQISQEGFSRTYNAQITFTWWKDWRFNLKYGYKKEEGETGGEKTTESRIHSSSIDVEARLQLPELWKIPIIGKQVRTAGEMKVKGRFSAEIKRSELNYERDNTDTYSTLLSSDFNVGTNLMLTVGSGMTFFVNHALPQNNYFAIDVNTTLTIKF
ncbi:hypothetical protein GTN66_06065 [bacterium]|nr:hypothetical protein [bacterium]NIN93006.1 hypothetical protein [bacterium]NIO73962.1 hypothetical protein [bacterium]